MGSASICFSRQFKMLRFRLFNIRIMSRYNNLSLHRYFATFLTNSVNIYTFDCKLVSSPKWPNMQFDVIQKNHVSLSDHMLAVRDQLNDKSNYNFYILNVIIGTCIKINSFSCNN